MSSSQPVASRREATIETSQSLQTQARISRKPGIFPGAALAFCLLLLSTHFAMAGSFAGRWVGNYANSTGERGSDSMVLSEWADGTIRGTWSGTIGVVGTRLNGNTAQLRGRTATRSYQISATVRGDSMSIQYIATRLDSRGSYNGAVSLRRQ